MINRIDIKMRPSTEGVKNVNNLNPTKTFSFTINTHTYTYIQNHDFAINLAYQGTNLNDFLTFPSRH